MVIHFVRHGHPDYKNDCLTELGKKQAEVMAEKMRTYGVEQIFSSTKGRALDTAAALAKRVDLPVVPCEFMSEIIWASINEEPILANGHPWELANILAANGIPLTERDWMQKEPWSKSRIVEHVKRVTGGFDELMSELGYQREGEFYRVTGENTNKTIAIFGHAGSSTAAISHLMNIPLPQVCGFLSMDYTSITSFSLSNTKGKLIYPKLTVVNDAKHIQGITEENVYGY